MHRVASLCVIPLIAVIGGCCHGTSFHPKRAEDETSRLKSLKAELGAKVAEMPKAVEKWNSYEVAKKEHQLKPADADAYSAAFDAVFGLRLEINELQLSIQRIGGFWRTDPDVKALGSYGTRDAALRRLLVRNPDYGPYDGRDEESISVNHVVSCPQQDGPPMMAVFKAESWGDEQGPGLAMGHIILFLSTGSHVPYFQGANVITKEGVVRDLDGDGIVEIADAINSSGGGGDDYYNFYVLPVTPEQKASLQVWCRETHDADGDFIVWGLETAPSVAGGSMDLVIGVRDKGGHLAERARYVWSRVESQWVGPRGSTTGEFYRPDPCLDEDSQIEAFATKTALVRPVR